MKEKYNYIDLEKRLLFILHRGWVEARLLAMARKTKQLEMLADTLEPIPGYMVRWNENSLDLILFNLRLYEEKYNGKCFDYSSILEHAEIPEF